MSEIQGGGTHCNNTNLFIKFLLLPIFGQSILIIGYSEKQPLYLSIYIIYNIDEYG